MTQEEKELLLKDLCARLPYGVKIAKRQYNYCNNLTLTGIVGDRCYFNDNPRYDGDCPIDEIKPYLFPLSSMTDEQKGEYNFLRDLVPAEQQYELENLMDNFEFVDNWRSIDYLNANYFDYRGLIEYGLAIDATGKNIY